MERKKDQLPNELKAVKNPHYKDDGREQILSVARNTSFRSVSMMSQDDIKQKMTTWLGTYALISDRTAPLKKVGFAPIIPSPITKHDTVFTILRNLSSLADTLSQKVLPFVCDEGVYHYVVDIYCHKPDVFKNLFPLF